ncbi:MAG: DPP IV N-terminal domain-containing protein [Oligoflexus sp.]|nr:DPP IV N-terminal domain-containing protein [Oligoflexus sp.]
MTGDNIRCKSWQGMRPLIRAALATALFLPGPILLAKDADSKSVKPAPWEELRQQLRSTRNFRLGAPFNFKILKDGSRVLYQKTVPPSTAAAVYQFDIRNGTETKLLDAEMLAAGSGPVSAEERALRERLRLMTTGINFFATDPEGRWILTPLKGKLFVWDTAKNKATEIGQGQGSIFSPKLSADSKKVVFVRDSNLYVTDLLGSKTKVLTKGGTEEKSFGVAEFIAQEELERTDGVWWSPDSKTVLYEEVDQSKVERLSIADPFRPDGEPQRPFYPRPGKANAKVRFGFVSAEGGKTTWIDFGKEDFEYVSTVRWTKHGPPTFFLLNRLQNKARLVSADLKSGKTTVLLNENDSAWVEIHNSIPIWLPDDKGFLWLADSSGSRQLELHDRAGKLIRAYQLPKLQVKDIAGVTEDGKSAFVEVAVDSAHANLIRIDLESGSFKNVAPNSPSSLDASSDFEHGLYVGREASIDGQDKTWLRSWDGKTEKLIPSAAAEPVMKANVTLQTTGPDAVQTAIVRPSDFVAGKKYPVLDHAYGGPSSLMVRSSGRAYLEDQVIADAMQAIVVRMDTRGTPDRGREWEKAISRKFGSLPVNEHAEVLKLLVKQFPEFDESRIGVYGWSYGGYFAAYAVLARPDVYKAGVAGAPPVDWTDYDTAYTERFLGLPGSDQAAYESASILPLVKAAKAQKSPRPLLIIHGTGDDNVFFFNSLKLVDEMERQALPYEFLPLMGMTHIIPDEALDSRRFERTVQFFRQHFAKVSEAHQE